MINERGQFTYNPIPPAIGIVIVVGILIARQMQLQVELAGLITVVPIVVILALLIIVHGFVGPRINRGDVE